LAKFAAIRRASSRFSRLTAERRAAGGQAAILAPRLFGDEEAAMLRELINSSSKDVGIKMATWKRLSRMTVGEQVDVNMDTVLHMQRFKDQTTIHFAVSQGDTVYTLTVKETPDEIHSRPPQAARGG
jgi:hypothetical protein